MKIFSSLKLNTLIIVIFISLNLSAQELPRSIYVGIGNGTNIGGYFGLGIEFFASKYFSGNLAVGSIHFMLNDEIDESKFDYDLGIKFYPIKYIFIGINYGLIDYKYYPGGSYWNTYSSFKDIRGFSYTLGLRSPTINKVYLSIFFGITSEGNENQTLKIIGGDSFAPRIGIMMGHSF